MLLKAKFESIKIHAFVDLIHLAVDAFAVVASFDIMFSFLRLENEELRVVVYALLDAVLALVVLVVKEEMDVPIVVDIAKLFTQNNSFAHFTVKDQSKPFGLLFKIFVLLAFRPPEVQLALLLLL